MRFQQKDKSLIQLRKKSLLPISLNNFIGQIRHILLFVDTGILYTKNPRRMVPQHTM